jgi:hypothetical protein
LGLTDNRLPGTIIGFEINLRKPFINNCMDAINGFYDDDGNAINPDLIPKPALCLVCRKNHIDDPIENILCAMNRHDQRNEDDFKCGAYEGLNVD